MLGVATLQGWVRLLTYHPVKGSRRNEERATQSGQCRKQAGSAPFFQENSRTAVLGYVFLVVFPYRLAYAPRHTTTPETRDRRTPAVVYSNPSGAKLEQESARVDGGKGGIR